MIKRTLWMLFLAVAPALAAQIPEDSIGEARAEQLRTEIERRFGERVKSELGLSEEQAAKLKAAQERFGGQRRQLMRRERDIRQGLAGQLRPGVAANSDSVKKLLDVLVDTRMAVAQLDKDEQRELSGFLTPVQRAQFIIMRQRLAERVMELRRERQGMMAPGQRPRPRRP